MNYSQKLTEVVGEHKYYRYNEYPCTVPDWEDLDYPTKHLFMEEFLEQIPDQDFFEFFKRSGLNNPRLRKTLNYRNKAPYKILLLQNFYDVFETQIDAELESLVQLYYSQYVNTPNDASFGAEHYGDRRG